MGERAPRTAPPRLGSSALAAADDERQTHARKLSDQAKTGVDTVLLMHVNNKILANIAIKINAMVLNLTFSSTGPPVHYAHKLAHRARLYLAQGSEAATTVSSGGATAPTGGSKQIPEIKDALKRSMFYC
ncbi:hypothetical protein HU200_034114 [Digitaria exilis]|uniref:Uncharacterized protein n=1 Tax=Digitaria exilis TaxID=1010633 RepID=A0A835BHC0_9POAL|nr:hypothetical protein HU200_034114 [Digitaria exilis]